MTTTVTTPHHLTLLLRHSTHTILISALPTTPLSSLKLDLLRALSSRHITELPAGTPVPEPEETELDRVQLGQLLDRKEYRKGFKLLREREYNNGLFDADETGGKRSKGKARASAQTDGWKGKGETVANNTVVGAGLRDGDVLAFRFRTEYGTEKPARGEEGEDEDDDMLENGVGDEEEEGEWDVVWPTYEDEE